MVFLVPAGGGRYELYSESQEAATAESDSSEQLFRRWAQEVRTRWHDIVESARRGTSSGQLARWRDAIVCRLAESIAEQRTLWSLRKATSAVVRYPSTLEQARANRILMSALADARRDHLFWFVVDLVALLVSGLLALVPGPNLIAYYFAFRVIGHFQSWRGARQSMEVVTWTYEPDAGLAELAALVNVPRDARASRVEAIAARLNLPRLSAFFDRVAVPSA
jgi:hypothetical protein